MSAGSFCECNPRALNAADGTIASTKCVLLVWSALHRSGNADPFRESSNRQARIFASKLAITISITAPVGLVVSIVGFLDYAALAALYFLRQAGQLMPRSGAADQPALRAPCVFPHRAFE